MSFFEKKADITQIIEYEKPDNGEDVNSVFIWKHPTEDFNTMTQLIVHESQEAIFFMNGQALDLFGPGRHTLETQNIPLIKKAMNWGTNGETPFHCEVYFINLVEQMSIKWGTDTQAEYMDPTYHFPIMIGASGEMRLQVCDSRKLLIKLVGTGIKLNRVMLVNYFREILNLRVKTYISNFMGEGTISIFDVDKKLEEFSEHLQERLINDFEEYGVTLKKFIVSRIQKPEDANFKRLRELHYASHVTVAEAELKQKIDLIEQETLKQKIILEAQGIAEKRRLEGYSYQDERGYDVAERLVQNEAVAEFSNVGLGMGMMAGLGGGIGIKVADIATGAVNQVRTNVDSEAVSKNENSTEQISFEKKVSRLKYLKEMGLITDEELKLEITKIM